MARKTKPKQRKIVVEVQKNNNENNTNLIRRFTRKVQETGIIQKVKSKRYNARPQSKLATKEGALKRMARRKNNILRAFQGR